jgi:UDP-N-acetylmuramoylalanine--D-glutamate ligase
MNLLDMLVEKKLSMRDRWEGKRILVIGAARQGTALTRYLVRNGAFVVLNDVRPFEQLESARESLADLNVEERSRIEWVFGSHPLDLLTGIELVCISGGVPLTLPLVKEAQLNDIPLSNDSQIFLEEAACRVIGITGSAGKTTTTSLVGSMARRAFQDQGDTQVWVGGNIGSPLIAHVEQIKEADLAVMELSSFQLEIMNRSPQIAAVLNVTPNHLDRHTTMEAYTAAKAHILNYQTSEDLAVIGRDDPGAMSLMSSIHGHLHSFGMGMPVMGEAGTYLKDRMLCLWNGEEEISLIHRDEIRLRGDHNLLNVLAACAIGAAAGLEIQPMREAIASFKGEPHRLEYVRTYKGADWYNDSIATAPERSIAAIRSFTEPIVLLAGGRDKDLPWDDFAALVQQRVDHLILFGEAAKKIYNNMMKEDKNRDQLTITICNGLEEAVQAAAKIVEPGDIVLLSPGGTSYDEFRDFEDRGEAYTKWVSDLI